MPRLELVLLGRTRHSCGAAVGRAAVLRPVLVVLLSWGWGSGQTPNPALSPRLTQGCPGHLQRCADSLALSNSLCCGGCDGPVITVTGAGGTGESGAGSPQPGDPPHSRGSLGASSPYPEGHWDAGTAPRGSQGGGVGGPREGWAGSLSTEDTLGELSQPAPLQLGALGNKSPRSDSSKQL